MYTFLYLTTVLLHAYTHCQRACCLVTCTGVGKLASKVPSIQTGMWDALTVNSPIIDQTEKKFVRVLERRSTEMQVVAALQGLGNVSIVDGHRFDDKASLKRCYDTLQRLRSEAHAPVQQLSPHPHRAQPKTPTA